MGWDGIDCWHNTVHEDELVPLLVARAPAARRRRLGGRIPHPDASPPSRAERWRARHRAQGIAARLRAAARRPMPLDRLPVRGRGTGASPTRWRTPATCSRLSCRAAFECRLPPCAGPASVSITAMPHGVSGCKTARLTRALRGTAPCTGSAPIARGSPAAPWSSGCWTCSLPMTTSHQSALAEDAMRLAVYTDYKYRRDDMGVYAEKAFTLFIARLADELDGLVLLGRVRSRAGPVALPPT